MGIVEFLLKKHGTKTVSVSTVGIVLMLASQLGYVEIPLPATRSYVDAHIAQATKGVAYIVRSLAEKDVDAVWYAVNCMRKYELQGALNRAIDDFKVQTGEAYQAKTCEDLEATRGAR